MATDSTWHSPSSTWGRRLRINPDGHGTQSHSLLFKLLPVRSDIWEQPFFALNLYNVNVYENDQKEEFMAQNYESVFDAMMLYRSLIERDVFTVREGLTKQQEVMLVGIVMREPITPGALADYLNLPPQNVSRNVIDLESQGLVSREIDPDNHRKVILSLTDAGRQFVVKHRKKVHDNLEASFSALSPDEQGMLVDASRIAATLLRKIVEKPAANR